jgi:hypothetical protein
MAEFKRFNKPDEARTFPQWRATFMEWIKEKLLNALFYFEVLSIAASIMGFAIIAGYLYGSVQTAKEYDSILTEYDSNLEAFRHHVEAQQAFYFLGYKVVPKGNVVTVKVTPKRRAKLAETKEAALRTIMDHEFSQEIYTKLIEEKMRKVLLVDVAEPNTAGAKKEGEGISPIRVR